MPFRHPWQMPIEWKCGYCNNIFTSREHPKTCPLCHRRSKIEPFWNIRDFSDIEMD